MAKASSPEQAQLDSIQQHRVQFLELLAANPNYFGNLKTSTFTPVVTIANDTFYEQVTCLGFNPYTNVLEAVVQVKQPSGYNGSLCQTGSYEFVRFFVDYGSGWEDAGVTAINVHDIAAANDCAKDPEKPLSYAASVQLTPQSNWCFFPVLPKVRAILAWNAIPTAGDPSYTPIWGNVLDAEIQIKPRPIFLGEIAGDLNKEFTLGLPPEELQQALNIPIPLPDPAPLGLAELSKLYASQTSVAAAAKAAAQSTAVPSHRFGFTQLNQALHAKSADSAAIELNVTEWNKLGLNWASAVANLNELDANVSYEQLECVGLEGAYGLERLVATFVIKQPAGYGGGLCSAGSTEYVAFWADWDDTCEYTYLGTVGVQVHDIVSIPKDGLVYSAVLPVNLSNHRNPCNTPKIGRVRAVLSWATPPSTTDPNALTYWGNLIDTHVQIQPGTVPNPLTPTISILGGIPTSMIDSTTGETTSSAVFALTNTAADSLGRPCPFGGVVSVQGELFPGYKYKLTVQDKSGGSPQDLITPLMLTRWDGTTYMSFPDPAHYFTYVDPTQNIDSLLGEWNTSGDDLWEITLQIADAFDNPVLGSIPDVHVLQLDNTAPQAVIHLDNNLDCSQFNVGAKLNGHFVAWDLNFGSYSLGTEPFTGPVSPSGGNTPTAALPSTGSAWSLDTTGMTPCGYVVQLEVADRSILDSSPGLHNTAPASVGFCLLAS
jgi:hypothetical protein